MVLCDYAYAKVQGELTKYFISKCGVFVDFEDAVVV